MKAYTVEQGIVAPLDRANVDTDLIIPKQFLKSIKRTGFGDNLFDELRFGDKTTCNDGCHDGKSAFRRRKYQEKLSGFCTFGFKAFPFAVYRIYGKCFACFSCGTRDNLWFGCIFQTEFCS